MTPGVYRPVVSMLNALLVSAAVVTAPAAGQESSPSGELTADELARMTAELQKEVENLRGWAFKRPVEARLCTVEELRAFVELEAGGEAGGWGKQHRSRASKKMIGLIPQDSDPTTTFEEVMISSAPAFYNHKTKALGIVRRAQAGYEPLFIRTMIVHELTHALDDQYFGLAELAEAAPATSDAEAVLAAVFEGAAILLQERYRHKAQASAKYDAAASAKDRRSEMGQMRAIFEAPPHIAVWIASFPCGARFLLRGDSIATAAALAGLKDPGSVGEAMLTAARDLPRSSEQILHPEKYWQVEQRDEPIVVNDQDVEKLLAADGLQIIHRDTFGELLCAVLTSPDDKTINPMLMVLPSYWTSVAATGWGGDRFFLLATGSDEESAGRQPKSLYGLWFTMWDTAGDRDQFIAEYEKYRAPPGRALLKLGELGAVYFFGFEEPQREALARHLQNTPLEYTRDGKPWFLNHPSLRRSHAPD